MMTRRRRDQPPPHTGSSEIEVLRGFLDYLRAAIAAKVETAPEPAVRTPGVPSGTNLLGLLTHLTHVEAAIFTGRRPRSWPGTFRAPADASVAEVVAGYRAAVAASDAVLDTVTDLSATLPDGRSGKAGQGAGPSVRWALVHMIEETGRHAGHADILRELIDGATGR